MTENSKICQEIKRIKDATITRLPINETVSYITEKFKDVYPDIMIKTTDDGLAVFNYGIGADFGDPVVQESRGIIIDLINIDVVCWPFRKFGKYDEPYADDIDWSSAIVQEKIDGSIIKLWWNRLDSKWMWSTNSTIDANDATYNEETKESFMNIIVKTPEYRKMLEIIFGHEYEFIDNIDTIQIDRNENVMVSDITYIFELTSPDNRVVIPYTNYKMRLIGARNNRTGMEYNMTIRNIDKPMRYDLHSLKDCIEWCSNMNLDEYGTIGKVYGEGFVVVDKYFNRIKIKSPEYMMMHGIISGDRKSRACLIDLIYHDKLDITSICREFPNTAHILCYYKYQVEELLYEATAMIDIARKLNNIFANRKEVAIRIKDKRVSMFGFAAISNPKLSAKEIITEFYNRGKLLNQIPEYNTNSFSDCFRDLPERRTDNNEG